MQAKSKVLNLALSLMIGGSLLAACSPKAATPTGTTPGTSTGTPVTTPTSSNPGTPATSASSTSALVASELQGVTADDATFSDSQKADGSFSTLALGIPEAGPGRVSATALLNPGADARPLAAAAALRKRANLNAATKARVENARKLAKAVAVQRRAALEASGAVKVNADGTITVDPAKLKVFVKQNVENRRAKFMEAAEKAKAKLQAFKATAKDQIQAMRRRNNITRNGDVVSTTNADGSVTKLVTVEFKNEKTGVTRNVTSSRTTKDGKLVEAEFDLKVTGPNGYTRTVHRVVTVNADGSRSWQTTANTTWANGAKSERSETRSVGADGSATGSGTLTITKADGTTKTYNYTVGVTASASNSTGGDEICTAAAADADASAPAASATPAATATPSATPSASPSASASPDATIQSEAPATVTVEDTADSTTDTVVVEPAGQPATEEAVDETADADAGVETTPAA